MTINGEVVKFGVTVLASSNKYIKGVGDILRNDKHRQKLTSKKHKSDALTKVSAKKLANLLDVSIDKAFNKIWDKGL